MCFETESVFSIRIWKLWENENPAVFVGNCGWGNVWNEWRELRLRLGGRFFAYIRYLWKAQLHSERCAWGCVRRVVKSLHFRRTTMGPYYRKNMSGEWRDKCLIPYELCHEYVCQFRRQFFCLKKSQFVQKVMKYKTVKITHLKDCTHNSRVMDVVSFWYVYLYTDNQNVSNSNTIELGTNIVPHRWLLNNFSHCVHQRWYHNLAQR